MNPDSRMIVPVNGTYRLTDNPPDPGQDSSDRTTSDRTSSASSHAYVDARFAPSSAPPPDYPPPKAVWDRKVLDWFDEDPLVENAVRLAKCLAGVGDLYRDPAHANGLILGSAFPNVPPTPIKDPGQLAAVIADRQRIRVIKKGNVTGNSIGLQHLRTLLKCEAFLQPFPPLDRVEQRSRYLPDFILTRPGYNDGGYGQRILHIGEEPSVEQAQDYLARFLGVMAFATEADRTNAVAAALTVLFRNYWLGAKPCLVVTSTKSHGGKETIVAFACGATPSTSISYQATDWALERAFVGAVKHDPDLGVIDVENARLQRGQTQIRSGFLERFITDPRPLLFSTGTRAPVRIRNEVVVAITTNFGDVSEDLMNRGLPIHLAPVGDVAARVSPIGNPKHEFLPQNRDRIEAELRGMVERWKAAGRPLDMKVRHPFTEWARTVGGILMVNGFTDFLGNYSVRRTADDPIRQALGLLGVARPNAWLRPFEWARLTVNLGLARTIFNDASRDSDLGREREIGKVLTARCQETFYVETEDVRMVLRLENARLRFEAGAEPTTRYRFFVLGEEDIPEDTPQS